MQIIKILFFILPDKHIKSSKQQIFKMITNKTKVQPFIQQEKNYDKIFFVKIFKGIERFAK